MSAEAKLESARKELLDLGLRNPLLNYRTLRARGLEITDERPTDLYPLLVQKNTPMAFLEQATAEPETDQLGQPDEGELTTRYTDDNLQTPYDSATLQKRLLHTHYTARSYIEENGANILYVALGMLSWYESDNSTKKRRAPLILIPVWLDRGSANEKFRVTYTGEEISTNLSLEAKLRIDYGLQLPFLPAGDELDVATYFEAVAAAVATQPRWSVEHDTAVVAFFSFSKLLMLNDLDPTNWPADKNPAVHPVIRALLSEEGFLAPPLDNNTPIDQRIKLSHSHQVVDADSSQALAILDVHDGRNLVIQGPPGTGKSQTITNLIAEAVGHGKTVLFVSEKMAALDVVKRRLDGLGLGDAALELHSHKATKAAVVEEIGRTMALGQPQEQGLFTELGDLMQVTHRLNDYATAMNTPIYHSGRTPYEAYGRLIQLKQTLEGIELPQPPTLSMYGWSAEKYATVRQHLALMQEHFGRMGPPRQHPFYGSLRDTAQPDDETRIRAVGQQTAEAFSRLRGRTAEVALLFGLSEPQTMAEIKQTVTAAERIVNAPNLFALDIANRAWYNQAPQITAALDAGERIAYLQQEYDDWLIPAAWSQDVLDIRQPLIVHGNRTFRFLSSDYREAKNKLLGLCRQELPETAAQQVALVDAILEVQEHFPTVKTHETLLAQLFGARWNGLENTKWYELINAGYWVISLHKEINEGAYPDEILAYLSQGFDVDKRTALQTAVVEATAALESYEANWRTLRQLITITAQVQALAAHEQQLWRYVREAHRFGEWITYQQHTRHGPAADLLTLWPAVENWPLLGQQLVNYFDHLYFEQLVDTTLNANPILGNFEGQTQQTAVELFQYLDAEFLRQNRYRLAHEHWRKLPQFTAAGQIGLLQHEVSKKRSHLPIRQLVTEAGPAMQRIKPIFMMSPLSIAMYLPPDTLEFDLVIFDEASQVRPVEAFGAIMRGRQTVVVGDSRQLPPTTFFDRVLSSGSDNGLIEEDDDDEFTDEFITASNESILDLFVAKGAPQRMLRWHYRSRHESLIAISNREFYSNQLILFPSPDANRSEVGLKLRHLPDTVYDRGGTRTNAQEAQAVAAAVMAHARTSPELTLGVAAFSSAQREAIEEALERLRRENLDTESFFNAHTAEPFFVKNLENVQGDERDVIFISIGYGRDAEGKVNLNFGPLNPAGGERRLNVLITRSRRRCEVFTNIKADDIDLNRTQSHGIAALKAYLAYAENGQLEELAPAIPRQTTIFEKVIGEALTAAGYQIVQEVGRNGVVIDVAVRDPREPQRYLLGILCDGDNYGRALFARDRDRIQPAVLNGLGWNIQRVWSTTWVNAPRESAAHLIETIQAIAAQTYTAALAPKAVPEVERYAPEPPQERVMPLYQQSALRVDLYQREGWHAGDHVGKLVSDDYYEYDPLKKQFTQRRKRYLEAIAGPPMKVLTQRRTKIPNPDYPGEIFGKLQYYLLTGRFYLPDNYVMFFHKGQRYFGYIDKETGDVYTHAHKDQQASLIDVTPALEQAIRVEAQWVAQIIREEGPIHQDELARSLATAANLGRLTAHVSDMTKEAAAYAAQLGLVEQQGDFWWPAAMTNPPVRDRSKLPNVSRKLDYISDTEIGAAAELVVQDAVAIRPEEIVSAVQKLFGFGSLGRDNQRRIYQVIAQLLSNGRFTVYGDEVTLPPISGRRASNIYIENLRLAIPPDPPKKKAEPIARPSDLPRFPTYQEAPFVGSIYNWQVAVPNADSTIAGWHHSQKKRQLASNQWWRYDPEKEQFLLEIAQGLAARGNGFEDFPAGDKLNAEGEWYGRLEYDIIDGVFLHNGYLSLYINKFIRSDKKYRLWRDPETGEYWGRRRKPSDQYKANKLWSYFAHAHMRYEPQSDQLIDEPSRTCRFLQEPVKVEAALETFMRHNEQERLMSIVAAEGPVHIKVIARRFAEGSKHKVTTTITQFTKRVVEQAAAAGTVRMVGEFVWSAAMMRPVIRNRSSLPDTVRKTEYIAPEELYEAIIAILEAVHAATESQLINLVGQALLNDKNLGAREARPLKAALKWLSDNDYVKQEGAQWAVNNPLPDDWRTVSKKRQPAAKPAASKTVTLKAEPYPQSNASVEPYKLADWTYVDTGRFMSQHYFPFDPENGRYTLDGRVPEKTVFDDFQTYWHTHAKLYYDSRFGLFYNHASSKGNPQVEVDEALEASVKQPIMATIVEIVHDEGPLHVDELSRSFARAAGRRSRSAIMTQMLEWAVAETAAKKLIRQEGAFLWPTDMTAAPLRKRNKLPKSSQNWSLISTAELTEAMLKLLDHEAQLEKQQLPTAVADLLGMPDSRGADRERLEAILNELIAAQHVWEDGSTIGRVSDTEPLLSVAETIKLADLTAAETETAATENTNTAVPPYRLSQKTFDLYDLDGWHKIAEGVIESEHYYRYEAETAQFVFDAHYTLEELLATREVQDGFDPAAEQWRSRPYAKLRYDWRTGQLLSQSTYWLSTMSQLHEAWREADGRFYVHTNTAAEGVCDRLYDPAAEGALQPLDELYAIPDAPTFLPVEMGAELRELLTGAVNSHIAHIVNVEGVVHIDEVAQRLLDYAAVGKRHIAHQLIRTAVESGTVKEQAHFLWPTGLPTVTVRNRAQRPSYARQLHYVCAAELELALLQMVVKQGPATEKTLKQDIGGWLGTEAPTSSEYLDLNRAIDRLVKHGFLIKLANKQYATADAERFIGADGLPTAVVAPEIQQQVRPYRPSALKIDDLYERDGWYSHLSTELWSRHYYRFDTQKWSFVYHRLPIEQVESEATINYPDIIPPAGKVYAKLRYDLVKDEFSSRPYDFFLQTDRGRYQLGIDPVQNKFYILVQPPKGADRTSRGYYFFDPDSGAAQKTDILQINLTMIDTPIVAEVESLVDSGVYRVDVERIKQILADEGKIHREVLAWRYAAAAGLSARNKIPQYFVLNALNYGQKWHQLWQKGEFVFAPDLPEMGVRSRSTVPARERQLQFVYDDELQAAVLLVLQYGSHLRLDNVFKEVAELLQVQLPDAEQQGRILTALEQLLKLDQAQQIANFWLAK
ncbi:MAG: DUF3320 domain-containing protein [Anaerolineales bacterium]|nr:DUF3320 domain-containing protein [Anaerolineales bacterium]